MAALLVNTGRHFLMPSANVRGPAMLLRLLMPRLSGPIVAEAQRCIEELESVLASLPRPCEMLELAPGEGLLVWQLAKAAERLVDRAYAASGIFDGLGS